MHSSLPPPLHFIPLSVLMAAVWPFRAHIRRPLPEVFYATRVLSLYENIELLRSSKWFAKHVVKKDPGIARQTNLATAETNFSKLGAHHLQ